MDVTLFIRDLSQNIGLGLSTFLVIAAVVLFIKTKSKWRNNFKYAPRATGGHPLFGHFIDMMNKPHILFENLRKKQGNIFSIGFGGKYAVVLTDWQSVKEFLKMDGTSHRATELVTLIDDFDHIIQINGKPWELRRKFAINAFKCLNLGGSTEDLITYEVSRMLKSLEKMDLTKDVDFRKLLATTTNNVGFSTICGKAYEATHPMSDFILDYNMSSFTVTKLRPIAKSLGFPPSVFSLISPTYRKSVKTMKKMADFLSSEIETHAETLDDQNPRDIIDYALIELGKSSETKRIKKTSEIIGDASIMLVAGTDPVRVTLEWAVLYLAEFQDMQEKIFKEIVDVYGDCKPTWNQRTSLPFTEAFMTECERMKTIMPILIPRKAPRDIKIQGYDIPKGSYIIPSLHCVHMDEQVYKDPKKFDPTRMLSVDGTTVVIPEYFVPFSYGNRNCIGDKIAKIQLFLILTGLLQKYRILPSKNGVNFEETLVVELMPVNSHIKMQRRF